jgi:undecaprenyl diphosphate synthase
VTIRRQSAKFIFMAPIPAIPREKVPRHIAIIMDGNGRWAVRQQKPRVSGHTKGARVVRDMVDECHRLRTCLGGPDFLTLYSFSLENWKRPIDEVSFLMDMYIDYLRRERPSMMERNIRFQQIGRLDHLPEPVLDEMQTTIRETQHNTGLTLTLALNYGSRAEIVDAVRAIARQVQDGTICPQDISEETISRNLYTAGMPDPDLLIRTAGEMRVSNYLLWQISYAELYVSPVLWPDFTERDLHGAMLEFAARNRRFGALDKTNTLADNSTLTNSATLADGSTLADSAATLSTVHE